MKKKIVKKTLKKADRKPKKKLVVAPVVSFDASKVIVKPRITEKAAVLAEGQIYAFEIFQDANKISVAKAIKALFNVTPVKVRVANIPSKKVIKRNIRGVRAGGRKAYVYLKKGDKIEFI